MSRRICSALAFTGLIAASGCATTSDAGQRCIEGLCLSLPPGSAIESSGHQHSIRMPGIPGRIDIQSFQPGPEMPANLDETARMLARRYEIEGNARVARVARGSIGSRPAALVDVAVTRPMSQVRRVVLLAAAENNRWIAVDATGPTDRFQVLQREFESRLRSATWSTP